MTTTMPPCWGIWVMCQELNCLPDPGAFLDQSAALMQDFTIIFNARERFKKEEQRKKR